MPRLTARTRDASAMAARGRGAVINVLTMVAHFGMAGMARYRSSKAALTLLTKAWAAEFGPAGVRVNTVSPGPTRTEGTEPMGDLTAVTSRQGRTKDREASPGPAATRSPYARLGAHVHRRGNQRPAAAAGITIQDGSGDCQRQADS